MAHIHKRHNRQAVSMSCICPAYRPWAGATLHNSSIQTHRTLDALSRLLWTRVWVFVGVGAEFPPRIITLHIYITTTGASTFFPFLRGHKLNWKCTDIEKAKVVTLISEAESRTKSKQTNSSSRRKRENRNTWNHHITDYRRGIIRYSRASMNIQGVSWRRGHHNV